MKKPNKTFYICLAIIAIASFLLLKLWWGWESTPVFVLLATGWLSGSFSREIYRAFDHRQAFFRSMQYWKWIVLCGLGGLLAAGVPSLVALMLGMK